MTFPTHAQFSQSLNSLFSIAVEGGTSQDLTLTFVSGLRASPSNTLATPRESFSILFEGPADQMLSQMMHPFSHPALGAFDLFSVPVGPDAITRRMRYEAIFS